ncbi:MAG: family 10 glycosylhydrolase [Cyanobacteria bacterium P01_E01_bin.35]
MKLKFINRQIKRVGIVSAITLLVLLFMIRLTIAPNHVPAKSELIKGVWLTHVGNAALTYTTWTDNVFHQLSRLNYNRVYVDVYNDGVTYPSQYAPRNYLLALPFSNPLKTAIREGKRQGLKIYAWYEHGMMTFGNSTLARQHPDWILTTEDNQKLIDNHWWLDPANSEVQQYFINLFTEVAANYPDLYGIQVDDHWGIPIQFGNKSEAMTDLTQKVVEVIRNTNPQLVISLSPNPLGFSVKKYSQNWLAWIKMGLIDELVMQLYRPTSQL